MENISILTGHEINESSLEKQIKKMCLNCTFCVNNCCQNQTNMESAKQKILDTPIGGYKITNIEITPLELKDATKKCKEWSLNDELIHQYIKNLFV